MPNQSQASLTEWNLMTPDFDEKCNMTNMAKVVKSLLSLTFSDINCLGIQSLSSLICPCTSESDISTKVMHPCVQDYLAMVIL